MNKIEELLNTDLPMTKDRLSQGLSVTAEYLHTLATSIEKCYTPHGLKQHLEAIPSLIELLKYLDDRSIGIFTRLGDAGHVVKLITEKQLWISKGLPEVRRQFCKKFTMALPNQVFKIPIGTLGILSSIRRGGDGLIYRVALKNPETGICGTHGVLSCYLEDFSFDVTPEEQESMKQARARVVINKTKDNLKALQKMQDKEILL